VTKRHHSNELDRKMLGQRHTRDGTTAKNIIHLARKKVSFQSHNHNAMIRIPNFQNDHESHDIFVNVNSNELHV